jgi:hypothetical protein
MKAYSKNALKKIKNSQAGTDMTHVPQKLLIAKL